jgi:hypothetical protein
MNRSEAADAELANELRRQPNLELAVILANDPRHRDTGIAALRLLASDEIRFRFEFGFATLLMRLRPELLPAVAECAEVFALAEEVGYSPDEGTRIVGEKPAALRIVGVRQPAAAVRLALARLRDPNTPNGELFVPIVPTLVENDAVTPLLDVVRQNRRIRIVQAIGRELGRLNAAQTVLEWLNSPTSEQRLAACRVAGFLPPTDALNDKVKALVDDPDKQISDAAVEAHERLQRSRIAADLVRAIEVESDPTHRWVLLDALVSVADPDGGGFVTPWQQAVRPFLTPAVARHLSKRLKERRKELNDQLDRHDCQ